MPIQIAGQVGPQTLGDGVGTQPIRQERSGAVVFQELHGRFYEQTYRGNMYSGGMTITSISAATFTSGTLGATCTPVIGVWNPSSSTVNLVIVQASLGITFTGATNTGGAPFVWATSTGNAVISTGNTPLNRKTLTASGSQAKDMTGVALTGLTTNLTVRGGSPLGGGSSFGGSFVGTAVGQATVYVGSVDNVDGSIIVPPGAVLALLATTTPVAHSAASMLLWEEVPI